MYYFPTSYKISTGIFPRDKAAGDVTSIHVLLVLRLRMVDLYLHSPVCLHDLELK
jgi:hypothetical protein